MEEKKIIEKARCNAGIIAVDDIGDIDWSYIDGLMKKGIIERIARGYYRLKDMPELAYPDLVLATMQIKRGVVCLISALSFHEITTEIPHEVWMAVPRHSRPKVDYPPVRLSYLAEEHLNKGIEIHKLDGVDVKVFSVEKTLADCFFFRNKIGLDVFVEALRMYMVNKSPQISKIHEYATLWGVENTISPYLQAVL